VCTGSTLENSNSGVSVKIGKKKDLQDHRAECADNVIYGHAAQHQDAAHHGNHWKIKCIFYYG